MRAFTERLWLFSRATRCVIRSRFYDHRPFFVSHLITTRCFAKCATCLWRGQGVEEQNTSKVIDFYRQAKNLGFVSTTFWGGEPLLRNDIFEILKACQKLGLITGLITNGFLLPDNYKELAGNLDFLIVSVDIPNNEHDQLRGVPGMFNNIVNGLSLIRAENPRVKVFVNSVVSKLNYNYVEQLVHFAENHFTTITFESVNQGEIEFPRQQSKTVVDWRLPAEEEQEIFGLIRNLKQTHLAINNSSSYLKLFQSGKVNYHCHAPKISIRVEPDGSVTNCQNRAHPLGNVYRQPLADILSSSQLKWLQKKAEACSTCVDSGVIESSLFWDFNMEVIINTLRLFMKR